MLVATSPFARVQTQTDHSTHNTLGQSLITNFTSIKTLDSGGHCSLFLYANETNKRTMKRSATSASSSTTTSTPTTTSTTTQSAIVSFAFSNGIPVNFDLYYDLRSLKTDAWKIDNYHELSGNDVSISTLIFEAEESRVMYEEMKNEVMLLLQRRQEERPRNSLLIPKTLRVAICCKSGRHRSVTFANLLHQKLQSLQVVKAKESNDDDVVLLQHLALSNSEVSSYARTPVRL